jgi:hypothetical protein
MKRNGWDGTGGISRGDTLSQRCARRAVSAAESLTTCSLAVPRH